MSFLNDWYRGTIETDSQGRSRGMGFTAAILKPLVDEQNIELGHQQDSVRSYITSQGEDPAQYDLAPDATVNDAKGAVVTEVRRRNKEEKKNDRSDRIEEARIIAEPGNRRADRSLDIQAQGQNNQMNLAIMQMQEQAATRRDDLLFRKEEARREDQRYNERMDKLDRKDRQAMMQNLAMGIASLGAAFAI